MRTEFTDELYQTIVTRAEASNSTKLETFLEWVAEAFHDLEVTNNLQHMYLATTGSRKKSLEFGGWDFDEADKSLVLLVGRFHDDLEHTLTLTEANKAFSALLGFLSESLSHEFRNRLDVASSLYATMTSLNSDFQEAQKVKLLLATNVSMSGRIRQLDNTEIEGVQVSYSIWDIDRFDNGLNSDSGREALRINFQDVLGGGLRALEGSHSDEITTYLAVVPGEKLAQIYRQHGSSLLQGNIRAFLSVSNKVNSDMQKTIREEPGFFLAYNNGITATAQEVIFSETDPGLIEEIVDLQIVNGGQTTASLAYAITSARDKSQVNLDNLFVQLKLNVIHPGEGGLDYDDIVSNIARFANTQNRVNASDFFSNGPFHRRMEDLSRNTAAPASEGKQYQTYWYYERARNQYVIERNRNTTPAQKKQFDLIYPRSQKFNKTGLAKYYMTWAMRPDIVSKGVEYAFSEFTKIIDKEWKEDSHQFGPDFYKELIAQTILFQTLDRDVAKAAWYEGGYKAQIVNYTLAVFRHLIEQRWPKKPFNLRQIWQNQEVPPEVRGVLINIAYVVLKQLLEAPDRVSYNVTQWAKNAECWNRGKKLKFRIPDDLARFLTGYVEPSESVTKPKNRESEDQTRIGKVTLDTWALIMRGGSHNFRLSPTETALLNKLRDPKQRLSGLLTELERERVENVLDKALELKIITAEESGL